MAETLKFGPEWLRNLSSDTHCRSQSPSAPTSRFKLAEHRYNKEDMLTLFSPDSEAPPELKATPKIFIEKALEPLGFSNPTETEQKLLSQMSSSNSANNTSRPPSSAMRTTLSLSQLRSSDSVRKTRGSGRLDPIYYRSSTTEDGDYERPKHFNRDPWDDSIPSNRGRGLGYTGRSFDESSEASRSMVADSWRGPKKKWNDEDTGNWRKQFPSQKPSNRSWREPWENSRNRGSSDDSFKEKVFRRSFSSSHAQNNHYEDELEQLPEWSTDDFGDVGTFDATGAFMSVKELERIEEQRQQKEADDISKEWSRNPSVEAEEKEEIKSKTPSEVRDYSAGGDMGSSHFFLDVEKYDSSEENNVIGGQKEEPSTGETKEPEESVHHVEMLNAYLDSRASPVASQNGPAPEAQISSLYAGMSFDVENLVDSLMASNEEDPISTEEALNFLQMPSQQKVFGDSGIATDGGTIFPKQMEQKFLLDDQLNQNQPFLPPPPSLLQQQPLQQQIFNQQHVQQHFQQHSQQNFIKGFVPPEHEDAYKWFYRDPQGDIQGPFTQVQMSEWFSVGYFNMTLLVKQGCDHSFLPIGTLVKLIGSNPFQIPYQNSAAMSHLKTQASSSADQSMELQHLQHLQLKQQQLDQMKLMQLMQMNPRNEVLSKLSTLQLLQTLQQQQQLHQNNSSRPILEAMNVQSSATGVDNGALSTLHQQLIQQHLQKQQLSQFLQQQQQLGLLPHRSFSQSSNNESQTPFIGGATASNSTSYLLQANQTSVPQQVASSAWKTANDIGSYTPKAWDKGLMGLELSRPITAQALEQLQYLALEKQQHQRIDSSATLLAGGLNLNGDQSGQMEGMAMGGVREQHIRALLQQEAARLQMALGGDERQRLVGSAEMMERQKLEELRRRQEKADALRKLQQEHLETFKKLKQQQQLGKNSSTLVSAALNLNSMQRQVQQLQRGSSPNFQSPSAAANHPLESMLNLQHQSLLQKQQVNKSWSLTNQSWVNGGSGNGLDVNTWGNSYSQQQFLVPPSHSATTSFTNTTSDPSHQLEEPFSRARACLYGSALPSASGNNIWLDGPCESHGLTGIASQQQPALGNSNSLSLYDKSIKESLIMWCESELKDQVPNGNIPSIIQQLLDSSAPQEILNIVKAFFVDPEKAAGFAYGFLDRRNQLMSGKCEQSTATMLS